MRDGMRKFLALVGAALFTWSSLEIFATWQDFGPRTCTSLGCPPQYSTVVFSGYVARYAPILLADLLGLAMLIGGIRGLTGATRTKYGLLCVLVAAIVFVVAFVPVFVGPPGGPVPAATGTSTTTVASP